MSRKNWASWVCSASTSPVPSLPCSWPPSVNWSVVRLSTLADTFASLLCSLVSRWARTLLPSSSAVPCWVFSVVSVPSWSVVPSVTCTRPTAVLFPWPHSPISLSWVPWVPPSTPVSSTRPSAGAGLRVFRVSPTSLSVSPSSSSSVRPVALSP